MEKWLPFSIINRELKNIEEIKLLSLSPVGWMNTQHTDPNNHFNTLKWMHWFK